LERNINKNCESEKRKISGKEKYNYVKQRVKGKPIMEVKMVVEFQNGTK